MMTIKENLSSIQDIIKEVKTWIITKGMQHTTGMEHFRWEQHMMQLIWDMGDSDKITLLMMRDENQQCRDLQQQGNHNQKGLKDHNKNQGIRTRETMKSHGKFQKRRRMK